MNAKGSVYKRCGCRTSAGEQLGRRCSMLRRRGHGSWYYALDIPAGLSTGRRRIRRGGFPTRAAATQALQQLTTPGSGDPRGRLLTTGQWLHMWLTSRISLRPSTLRGYASHVNDYLHPHLGIIPLQDLDIRDLQHMFTVILRGSSASGRPVTAATLKRIHATLRTALNAAIRERLITDNPARYVELPPAHSGQPVCSRGAVICRMAAIHERSPCARGAPCQHL
ncbi:hypothetical protein [Actinoallomurus sp. NPDC050550]|uniref:hypothetical protein n=1 Tax=Actinoallomurus sp. NPDC050550 TaxID=3154937 RepID=UPI0033D796A7